MFGYSAGHESEDEEGGQGVGENPWKGKLGFRIVTGSNTRHSQHHIPPLEPNIDEKLEFERQLFVRILFSN